MKRSAGRRFTLRALEPTEAEVQAGVLRLCGLHSAVGLAVRVNSGDYVVMRPPPGPGGWTALRAQIAAAVEAGYLRDSQIGWVRGAPAGTPDILGQMASGHVLGLEVKAPGKMAKPHQTALIESIAARGGLGAVVSSVSEADVLFSAWGKRHDDAVLGELRHRVP